MESEYRGLDTHIKELINRRRRQIIVNSIIYYTYDHSHVSDTKFDGWCNELAHIQRENPKLSEEVTYELEAFRDFNGDPSELPLNNPRAQSIARQLISRRR